MKNVILPAILKNYSGEYATIELPQLTGSVVDRTLEEIMCLKSNIYSQDFPEVNSDVLVCFDNFGDVFILGTLSSENQPSVEVNKKDIVFSNGEAIIKQTEDGKFFIGNSSQELLSVFDNLIDKLINAVIFTPAGSGKFSAGTITQLEQIQTDLSELKE